MSTGPFTALRRALSQWDDRVFLGVVLRAVAWAVLAFALLRFLAIRLVHGLLSFDGPLAMLAEALAGFGATMLAVWLFVPVAAAIATLHTDRIASAVERVWYPDLPPTPGAPLVGQLIDALALGVRLLGLGLLSLVLILLVPGIGFVCAWGITGYALGRGLFLSVAMRRLDRARALQVYRRNRAAVLLPGLMMAPFVWLPVVNLVVPVLATAAMVHVLDGLMRGAPAGR